MPKLPSDTFKPFGTFHGRTARIYTLENEPLRVRITDYSGILVSVEAPDREGRRDHILLDFRPRRLDYDRRSSKCGEFGLRLP